MTATPPSATAGGSSAGLRQTSSSAQFSLSVQITIAGLFLILWVMIVFDWELFPGFVPEVRALVLGAEAEAWVAIVLGIEVWFTFLKFRSAAPPSPQVALADVIAAIRQASAVQAVPGPVPPSPIGPEGKLASPGAVVSDSATADQPTH